MRVLHLPVNTASIPSHTVRALRRLGVDAEGIVFATNPVQGFEGLRAINMGNKRNPHQALLGVARFGYHLARYLRRGKPDLLHWYYSGSGSTLNADLALIRALGVPGVIEWTGADIRIPDLEFAENPYYTAVFHNGYEYRHVESREMSHQRQHRFAAVGFACAAAPGMMQYVQRDIFPQVYAIPQRLMLSDYPPSYPNADTRIPLVVHSPTAPVAKGTPTVLRVIGDLKQKYAFEFRLIQRMKHSEAMKLIQNADIVLDQFVLGDRGIVSLEAMALGKPVVCYLKPSLVSVYPSDLPIVNATQETLAEVLEGLLTDGARRLELGVRGRAFVEKYHDALKVVPELVRIYQEIVERHRAS